MAATTIYNLPTLVRRAFRTAQETGDLTFYQTEVSILQCNELPFQVRFSSALANKPKSNKSRDSKEKPVDPFLNPSAGLLVTDLPLHNIVLNKFPIIPNHFILATKEFKEQIHMLEEGDLAAAYSCLMSYRENGEELFGFFNSGEHSGASQPHRHIQFLPVQSMQSGIETDRSWAVLADGLLKTPKPNLPFAYFTSPLPENPSSKMLHDNYIALHNSACQIAGGSNSPFTNSQSSISYNLGLTDRIMVLCPRASEGTTIKSSTGQEIGSVALNGTVLGGTLLVKSQAEWDALRNNEAELEGILSAIGFSPNKVEHDGKL